MFEPRAQTANQATAGQDLCIYFCMLKMLKNVCLESKRLYFQNDNICLLNRFDVRATCINCKSGNIRARSLHLCFLYLLCFKICNICEIIKKCQSKQLKGRFGVVCPVSKYLTLRFLSYVHKLQTMQQHGTIITFIFCQRFVHVLHSAIVLCFLKPLLH